MERDTTSVTDRQTDRITMTKTTQCIASRGKKEQKLAKFSLNIHTYSNYTFPIKIPVLIR